ncbi:MAG: pitrilysin family protein [Bacillota bacterium]|nr:pitrilysin family protein [Negativicutes bacterium]
MYQQTTLQNGLRIVTEEIPSVKSVTIGIWIGTGSRAENEENLGVSHFLEHLLFKGTKSRSAKQIAEAVDSVGGQLNAFTAKEYTCYYIKVIDRHYDLALDILSDMVLHPKFSPEDLEKEREVVLEEIHMNEDTPDELIHDLFMETVWPAHALGRSILGTAEAIGGMHMGLIKAFYEKHYVPANMVVACAGNIKHEQLLDLAAKYLGNAAGGLSRDRLITPQFNSTVLLKPRDTEQTHICIGVRGLPSYDEQAYALNVLNTVLGGGLSSRLFQSIREERGLAYAVYSYLNSYQDAGLITIYAGTRPANAQQVITLVQAEIKKISAEGITPAELSRAKEYIIGNLLLGLENTSGRMMRLGKLALAKRDILSIEEVINKVRLVSIEDVLRLSHALFRLDSICITALGSGENTQEIFL